MFSMRHEEDYYEEICGEPIIRILDEERTVAIIPLKEFDAPPGSGSEATALRYEGFARAARLAMLIVAALNKGA